MKKILFLFIALFSFAFANAQYSNEKFIKGDKIPDIILKDTAGKDQSLYKLLKKSVVLIDFWASWCGPCRRANPSLVKFYENYSAKKYKDAKNGFKVVSISLDQNKESWVKAIKADNLYWPYHLSDLKGWASEAARVFGIQFVPQCMLVDKDGKILGTYMFAEEAKYELDKLVK